MTTLLGVGGTLTITIGPSTGSTGVQEVTFFEGLSLTRNFVSGDQLNFRIPAFSPEAAYVDELAADVWLRGVVDQRFRVTNVDQAWGADGQDVIAVTAVSYKRLLNARHVVTTRTYTGIDQGEIIWRLIEHTQAQAGGDWGVTQGSTTTGVTRDRVYVPGENIGHVVQLLTEVIDGPWFDIDVDLVLTAALPSSFPTMATPCQLGVVAREMNRKGTAARFANAVYVDAKSDTTVPVWAEDPTVGTDPRGRWEKAFGFPNVTLQDTLDQHAEGELDVSMSPPATWRVVLEPSRWLADANYQPGDFVVVVVPRSTAAPVGTPAQRVLVQVMEIGFELSADGSLGVAFTGIEVDSDLA